MRTHLWTLVAVGLIVSAAQGARGQCCGDCDGDGDGAVANNELITAVNNALGECGATSGGRLPATGQTTSYGPGSDGAVQAGAARSFTDNDDGTITDNLTG